MELRLVLFQICSADPFLVVLVMGGFGSSFSKCFPLGILEKTQTERQEVAQGMLVHLFANSQLGNPLKSN